MVVGIIEFEEKTGIGQENAAVVIPEILINHLKNIGKYRLAERVVLHKALEEQQLQLSGITSEETAAKVGKVFGLDAFIVGSAMKVGQRITISARVIRTESAEIIATGTVQFTTVGELDKNLRVLAYQLSGYSAREYQKIALLEELSKNSFGVQLGGGVNIAPRFFFNFMSFQAFYQGRYFEVYAANSPLAAASDQVFSMQQNGNASHLLAVFYPFTHVGFGIGCAFVNIPGQGKRGTLGQEYIGNLAENMGVCLGISYRVSEKLRMGLYPLSINWGWGRSTSVPYEDQGNIYEVQMQPIYFGGPIIASIEYYVFRDFSIKFNAFNFSRIGSGFDKPSLGRTEIYTALGYFILELGYRFSF